MNYKLKRPYISGPGVKRLQEMLDGISIKYDTGSNDGIYGPKTAKAVLLFQMDNQLRQDSIAGPSTLSKIDDLYSRELYPFEDSVFVDRRNIHPRPKLYGARRSISTIHGVTLHQTGCLMPSNPKGWDRLNAHVGVTQGGRVILVNDFEDRIWHAQKASRRTIGIEIEGNYLGKENDTRTHWKPGGGPHSLNDRMLDALQSLKEYLVSWFILNNLEWKYIFAHRQASKKRSADPGQEIWEKVAMNWIDTTGATDGGSEYKFTGGLKIPFDWNAEYNNSYWSR